MRVVNWKSREELINNAIVSIKNELQKKDDMCHVLMLSGGSTPLVIYQRIAKEPFSVDDNAVITYSDERFVPSNNKESNYFQTKDMLKAIKIKAANVVRVQTELGLAESTDVFHNDLFNLSRNCIISLGFLGMGTDGHTASLFSLEDVDKGKGKMAITVTKEQPPHRISVSKHFLDQCQKLILLITGEEKKEILNVLLNNPDSIPAGKALKNHPNVEVWVSP